VRTGPVDPEAAARGRLRASDADREQVIEQLKAAFVQGRLTRDELDLRAGQAFRSRTYAELAGVTAGIPVPPSAARRRPGTQRPPGTQPLPDAVAQPGAPPAAGARPRCNTRPRHRRARAQDWPPENGLALKWGLALATVIVPATIAAALLTRSKDLFSVTVVLLMAYVLTVLVAVANAVAVRFENEPPRGSRRPASRLGPTDIGPAKPTSR